MPIHEQNLNQTIAEILGGMRRHWTVTPEKTDSFRRGQKRPDIVILQSDRPAVLIENEYMPARTVESDATERLGKKMKDDSEVRTVIALRSPAELKTADFSQLKKGVAAAEFDYALLTGKSADSFRRFPAEGWLTGNLGDLADFAYRASVPTDAVQAAAIVLEDGVQSAAAAMHDAIDFRTDIPKRLAELFKQEYGDGEQTRRMAMLIIINAFVFQYNLAGFRGIRSPAEIERTATGSISGTRLIDEWKKILEINYWPIFDIACRIVMIVENVVLRRFLKILYKTARQLAEDGVIRSHDLSGRVFQRLISDRKYLATFYTRPASAALLANLAVPEDAPVAGGSWKTDAEKYVIADFACGTGTLLAAAYQRAAELHEKQGGDMQKMHPKFMENSLVGCDVMPAAVHLTASMLSGAYPAVQFEDTRLFTLVYGKTEKNEYAIGSLELLAEQSILPVFDTAAKKQAGKGEKRAKTREIEWRSHDLVIMNPPFTRSTNHEGAHKKIPNPVWAGFGMDAEMQKALAAKSAKNRVGTCAHGNAGVASDFIALADKMVSQNGITAFVLPISVLAGESWKNVRAMWARDYDDICIVSLSSPHIEECSFSADTGMAEILFVGKRINGRNGTARKKPRGIFVVLSKRPENEIEAAEFARAIRRAKDGEIRKLEGKPVGGTPIFSGKSRIGDIVDAPLPEQPEVPWCVSRVRDMSLAQVAHGLVDGRLRTPGSKNPEINIPICGLGNFAMRGFIGRDINGIYQDKPRGPFDIVPISESDPVPTYPCLWAHDSEKETKIIVAPDSCGVVRMDMEDRAMVVWQKAGRVHHNSDFQFNAQALAVAMTEKSSIGGRAWPNLYGFKNPSQEDAYALWSNSTLGLLLYWWYSNKPQEGRGTISLSRLPTMPTLDLTKLTGGQLAAARKGFNAVKNKPLLPFYRANEDKTRAALDEIILADVLGLPKTVLDGVAIVREKLCREPSVRGGKE